MANISFLPEAWEDKEKYPPPPASPAGGFKIRYAPASGFKIRYAVAYPSQA